MEHKADSRRASRALLEIAHKLESSDDPDERVRRALALARDLLPYERCALLTALPGRPQVLLTVPALPEPENEQMFYALDRAFCVIEDEEQSAPFEAGAHLTVPIVGLDRVIGVLRVQPPEGASYDEEHLRMLSVVGAQIGAYLSLLRLREDVEEKARELALANEFQQRLVGVVSHELRNPLAVIIAMASNLLDIERDPSEAKIIERAIRIAKRASRIIHDLLDVTRVRAGGGLIPMTPVRTHVRELVGEVIEDARAAHPGREIEPVEDGDAGAPFADWDADRVAQAITNLIDNAMQHGSTDAPVTVRVSFDDVQISIAVHNVGEIIPKERAATIFDPFKRGGAGGQRSGDGLGLGLYIVDQIARAHGGSARVSTGADGTTFTIQLPRAITRTFT